MVHDPLGRACGSLSFALGIAGISLSLVGPTTVGVAFPSGLAAVGLGYLGRRRLPHPSNLRATAGMWLGLIACVWEAIMRLRA